MCAPVSGAALLRGVVALSLTLAAVAQDPAPSARPAPPALLQALDLTAGTLQAIAPAAGPGGALHLELELAGARRVITLHHHDVRAPGFRLLLADSSGVHEVPAPPSVTWRGAVDGDPDAVVAAGFWDGGLRAVVRLGDGSLHQVQPARELDPAQPIAAHVVAALADLRNLPFHCGVTGSVPAPVAAGGGIDNHAVAELAVEADYPYYQSRGGNSTTVQNDLTTVLNAVDAIYQADVQITHVVTAVLVRTAPDPYTTSNPSGLLTQFGNWWNANQSGVVRDLAHLFTGRNLSGSVIGVGYLGVVCSVNGAYALSETTFTGSLGARVGLTAHELGHNWGANHCDGDPDCRIMCSGLGGCSGNLGAFGSRSRTDILAFRNVARCLQYPGVLPVLNGVAPATVPSFRPPSVTLAGTGFLGASAVQVGGVVLGPGAFTLVSDTSIRLMPPGGLPVGPVNVTVTNQSGTSQPVTLNYAASLPPVLEAPAGAWGGFLTRFDFAALPGHPWFLVVALSPATVTVQGLPLLRDFSILAVGTLDAAGIGAFQVPVPPGLGGLTVHTQLVDADPITLQLVGTSTVHAVQLFF